jgi:hypothetical protein
MTIITIMNIERSLHIHKCICIYVHLHDFTYVYVRIYIHMYDDNHYNILVIYLLAV